VNTKPKLYVDSRFYSPYAMSAYVALKEKGLGFDLELVDLRAQQNQSATFKALSLTARVPALELNGFALSESSAIVEYLEDIYPAPTYPRLLPSNPQQRARARQIQAWLRSDLMPIREERPTTVIFDTPIQQPLSEAALRAVEQLFSVAGSLIVDPAHALFGAWCIADTELALMLNRLVANGDAVPAKLRDYVQRQWARPSVQDWLSKDQPSP
jgi:glutathione S-transferase